MDRHTISFSHGHHPVSGKTDKQVVQHAVVGNVVKEGALGLELNISIEFPGISFVTAEVQLPHGGESIPFPAGEKDGQGIWQGAVRFGEEGQVFRQLRCHIEGGLGELFLQVKFVRRPVGGADVVEKLLPAPVAQHLLGDDFLVQHDGAAVGHIPMVEPDLLPVFSLPPERPESRISSVLWRGTDPGLCPLPVGGVGDPFLRLHGGVPPDAAPLKEHRVAVRQRSLVDPGQGRPGGLGAEAVVSVVALVGHVVGCTGVGLAGGEGLTPYDLRGCVDNGLPPRHCLLQQGRGSSGVIPTLVPEPHPRICGTPGQ